MDKWSQYISSLTFKTSLFGRALNHSNSHKQPAGKSVGKSERLLDSQPDDMNDVGQHSCMTSHTLVKHMSLRCLAKLLVTMQTIKA